MSTRRHLLLLGLVFALVQGLLFFKIGVFTGLEAEKYIREGRLLATTGSLSDPKFIFYLPVILLTALCTWLGLPLGTVVLVQVVLAGVALWCFYRFAKELTNSVCALAAALLLAVFVPLQMWNFYLYSDSIFISGCIIFLYVLQRRQQDGLKGWLYTGSLLLLLCFARPAGLLLVPPFIIYLLLRSRGQRKALLQALAVTVVLLAALYAAVTVAYTGGNSDMDALKPFVEEHIICFVPQNPGGAHVNVVHTASPLHDLLYYIGHNPGHFTGLVLRRVVSFYNLTRPHYSAPHNAAMVASMLLLYLPALYGWWLLRRKTVMLFITALLVVYPLGIALQCDDWHSRFTMTIIPAIMVLAVYGWYRIVYKQPPAATTP